MTPRRRSPAEPAPLDERRASVLRAVVAEYIETAQPVGSGRVARAPGVNVSPATVRHDMANLEQEGFLHQPHTSAGRVPTEKGYRFFVDGLERSTALAAGDSRAVRAFFADAHGELEQMLADTTQLLSDLTRYAAVVVAPPADVATIRSIQVVGLAPQIALVVVVLSNGAIDKHTIELDEDTDDVTLAAAGAWLATHLVGEPLAAVPLPDAIPASGPDTPAPAIAATALAALGAMAGSRASGDQVYIGGASRMASAFDAVATVSEVLQILEQQYVVVSLLHDVLDRGLHVAIGTETGIQPLADCSVVVAPYEVEGELSGSIAVLGPTRMNYPQALAAVAVVGQRLGQRLSDVSGAVAGDYYELLGVGRDASSEEIKRAFRQLARELHPDTNPDPAAEARFKEVALAYETLSDPDRRRRYDTFGPEGAAAGMSGGFGGFGGGLGDLFEAFFNTGGGGGRPAGPGRGPDLEAVIDLSFEEAVFGTQAPVTVQTAVPCDECEATGAAPGTSATTCPECAGRGQVQRVRQSLLGQMVTTGPCPRCGGLGSVIESPCPACAGEGRTVEERTYTVDVPAGIDQGSTLRLSGRGAAGPRGGGLGDLYVHIRVRPHERFSRQGNDLAHELHVSMTQAALGTHLEFETLDGDEALVIPAGTQTGRVFRLRGRGVPHLEGRGRGDLLVAVVVETPTGLGDAGEALLRELADQRGEHVAPPDTGFLSKIRSAFR